MFSLSGVYTVDRKHFANIVSRDLHIQRTNKINSYIVLLPPKIFLFIQN